jgi:gamma-glutamylaminecyclotransferase
MTLVFVYGTLKRGGTNHHFLAGQEFIAPSRTRPGFALYDLDGYPGMVADPAATEGVSGEVWSVGDTCLDALDELEGTAQGLYSRGPVPLEAPFADGAVEAYFYLKSVEGLRRAGPSWTV